LKAIPLVLGKEPYVRFILCGDGDIDNCKLICESEGISDKVIFCGWVRGQKKIDEIKNADVFILPSYREGLPVSILEAMSAGLPIVSTNVGGIPNIIKDGINGFLFKPGDLEAITDRIIKLSRDEVLRLKMGEKNVVKANKMFDVDIVIKQLCQIYKELLIMTEITNSKVPNKTG
jgi:glycosyltransferase involved in cell wall biosynthesis